MEKKKEKVEKKIDVMAEMSQPIIVDLGRQQSKKLTAMKNGEGKLWNEVLEVVGEVKDMLGKEADGKMLVPLILIYEKKTRRHRIEKLIFPLADWDDDDDWDDDEDED